MPTPPRRIAPYPPVVTRAICEVLAQTSPPGLSKSEITRLLQMVRINRLEDGSKKCDSLFITLHNKQTRQKAGNSLVAFVNAAMEPSRYVRDHVRFLALQDQFNEVLVLYGLRIADNGKLATAVKAATLDEAGRLAGQLMTELRRRDAHSQVLLHCDEEIIKRSLFHAMTETAQSVPARVRTLSSLNGDGQDLCDVVFGTNRSAPRIYINDYQNESQISEHKGFKQILIGIHGHIRNPRAHAPRLGNQEDRTDFLDLMSLISYVHRRLDRAGSL